MAGIWAILNIHCNSRCQIFCIPLVFFYFKSHFDFKFLYILLLRKSLFLTDC